MQGNFTTTVNLAGLLSEDGFCHGTTYSYGLKTWENVVVTADINISIRNFKEIVNSHNGTIEVREGIYRNFDDKSYDDMEHGLTIWEAVNNSDYKMIYEGEAEKATVTSKDHQTIFYNVKLDDFLFVISIIGKTTPSGWQTEYPNLIIIDGKTRPTTNYIDIKMNLLFLYPYKKFVYSDINTETLYANLAHEKCVSEEPNLQTKLLSARSSPQTFAYYLTQQHGFTAFTMGEVIKYYFF